MKQANFETEIDMSTATMLIYWGYGSSWAVADVLPTFKFSETREPALRMSLGLFSADQWERLGMEIVQQARAMRIKWEPTP